MKEITMSIHEFMEIQRGNLTLDDLNLNTLDKIAGKILKNKKLKTVVIANMAYMNMSICAYAETTDPFQELRHGKDQVVFVLQFIICIICIVMCLIEIGKALIGNRSNEIGGIVTKYAIAIVAVCLVPLAFTWIAHLCHVDI
jgi:hypothetical protein